MPAKKSSFQKIGDDAVRKLKGSGENLESNQRRSCARDINSASVAQPVAKAEMN